MAIPCSLTSQIRLPLFILLVLLAVPVVPGHVTTGFSTATIKDVISWSQLVTACAAPSSVNVTLSPAFQMGTYTAEIDFSGKAIVIFGSNATLDASQMGRFFLGNGTKGRTSLELHDMSLVNGKTSKSGSVASFGPCVGFRCADGGGAIYIWGDVRLEIYTCTFKANVANRWVRALTCTPSYPLSYINSRAVLFFLWVQLKSKSMTVFFYATRQVILVELLVHTR
jgi:hypothetical protein